jgi:hypothetical protein
MQARRALAHGQKCAKKVFNRYGEQLVCVRIATIEECEWALSLFARPRSPKQICLRKNQIQINTH